MIIVGGGGGAGGRVCWWAAGRGGRAPFPHPAAPPPCAALWLAHPGPHTGQGRAQACASKHPDGYVEALF